MRLVLNPLITSLTALAASFTDAKPANPSSRLATRQGQLGSPSRAARVYAGTGWIEHIAARANGQLLMPHTNVPELWGFDPATKAAAKLATFTGALGLTGIAEVAPDVFAVMAGNFSTRGMSVRAGSWAVWTVDFNAGDGASKPKTARVRAVPDSGFFLGTTALDNRTVLIADAQKGCILKMDIGTGEYSIVLKDRSMDRNGGLAGIHGLHYIDGYAYYTNTFGGGFWKLKVDSGGKAIGSPSQIAPVARPEDFVLAPAGTWYVGRMDGGVTKIGSDGKASQFTAAQAPTGLVLGRGEKDKNVLYISNTSGSIMSVAIK